MIEAKKIPVYLDIAQYRLSEDSVVIEAYYSLPDTSAYFIKDEHGYTCSFGLQGIFESNIDTVLNEKWSLSYSFDEKPIENKMNLFGVKSFNLPTGQYKFSFFIIDKNDTSTQANISFQIVTRRFAHNSISISDLQFAHLIEEFDSENKKQNIAFKKSNLYVAPNPSLEYVSENPVVYSYLEIYNAQKYSPDGFIISYTITDGSGFPYIFYRKIESSTSDGIVDARSFKLDTLPSGVYSLRVSVLFPADEPVDSVQSLKRFYIINPMIPPRKYSQYSESALYSKSEFATMSEAQADKEFQMAMVKATSGEIDLYNMCESVEAKRKFLFKFWFVRDPDSTTYINEALMKFRESVEYANRTFTGGVYTEGWRSDRGRVVRKYGIPSQRDCFMAESNARAYEKWLYHEHQGGIEFVFVDMTGFGNYILVHSSAQNEVRNDYWYDNYVVPNNPSSNQKMMDTK